MSAMWSDILPAGAIHVSPTPTLLLLQPQQCVLGHSRGVCQDEEEDQRGTRLGHNSCQVIPGENYVKRRTVLDANSSLM